MMNNNPEVVAYLHVNKENPEHRGASLRHDASCTNTLINTEPLIRLSDYEALQAECAALKEALEEIVYPIKFMQERLEEGEQLNGLVAVQLAKDPEYLKDVAKAALTNYHK